MILLRMQESACHWLIGGIVLQPSGKFLQITPVNSPVKTTSSSKIVSHGKPIQQSLSFARALTSDYDTFAKQDTILEDDVVLTGELTGVIWGISAGGWFLGLFIRHLCSAEIHGIIGFVYKEFPIEPMKEIEDKQSSPIFSIKDLLKGKSLEELAEIAQMAAIQCRQLAGGKHSPASSEGSSTAKLPYAPVSFTSKWYQNSQDPYDGYEDYDLNLD
uniref:Uncharacterized protein n=1 Tax=Fagus sylvatica TaxID=28930 RepID=A0A2N9FX46_FAGSY